MTLAEAIEAQFLTNMTEEEKKRFTPSELLLSPLVQACSVSQGRQSLIQSKGGV
jgi:hypothetical protein